MSSPEEEVPVTVLYNYEATDVDELTVKKDDILLVLAMYDDGWWLIKRGNKTGLVPANYLELHESQNNKTDTINDVAKNAKSNESEQFNRHGRNVLRNSKDNSKNSVHKSTERHELKTLREEAEQKINALR